MRLNTIRAKIALPCGFLLAATTGVIVQQSASSGIERAMGVAEANSMDVARAQSEAVASRIEGAYDTLRGIALTLSAAVDEDLNLDLTREDAQALLSGYLATSEGWGGLFTAWEPDAFDMLDMAYADVDGHDETGRFAPYFSRGEEDAIELRPLTTCESVVELAGGGLEGDFYLQPKESGDPFAMAPQPWNPEAGGERFVRLTVPIRVEGDFFGVVGGDLDLGFLQARAEALEAYEHQAELTFVDAAGTLLARTHHGDQVGTSAGTPAASASSRLTGGTLTSSMPVAIPGAAAPWGISLQIPEAIIRADADALLAEQVRMGLFAIGAGLVLVWLVVGRFTAPLKRSLRQVQAISKGDLTLRTNSRAGDEVGDMGRALDGMSERIEQLVGEAKGLTTGLRHGDLSVRADAEPFEGCFHELCEDMNRMIDAVAEPVAETREVLAHLAKGELDQRCSERHEGAFGEIGHDLNEVLTVLTELTGTINRLIRAGKDGHLDERADPRGLSGTFRNLCVGVNDLMEAIVAPIQESAQVLSQVAEGDLTQEVTGDFAGDHGRIKDSLNETVAILRTLLGDTNELLAQARSGNMNQRLDTNAFRGGYHELCSGINDLLDSIVGPVRNASSSLSESSERMDVVARQMSDDAEVANEQTDSLAELTGQVSERVSTVSCSVSEMAAGIEEISQSMTKASGIAGTAVQRAGRANEVIGQLGQSSQEIDNVIKMITSIAEQTNLLALNATIEAARAGEAGKGFAVVAGEVKELANQTAIATEDIGKRIHEIQTDTTSAVEAIAEISEIISEINDIQGIVASAMVEQTATSDGVRRDLSEASEESNHIAQGVAKVSELMMAGLERARETQESAKDLSVAAEGLTRLVN